MRDVPGHRLMAIFGCVTWCGVGFCPLVFRPGFISIIAFLHVPFRDFHYRRSQRPPLVNAFLPGSKLNLFRKSILSHTAGAHWTAFMDSGSFAAFLRHYANHFLFF